MQITIPDLAWKTLSGWQTHSLALIKGAGLIRFIWGGSVIFISYAASESPGLGARISAYRRGDDPNHYAAQQISRLKDQLELQIAWLDLPPREIRDVCHELIRKEKPALNQKNPKRGRY